MFVSAREHAHRTNLSLGRKDCVDDVRVEVCAAALPHELELQQRVGLRLAPHRMSAAPTSG
jgi:hypothetical protein